MSDRAKPCPICKETPDETSSDEGWILFCCKFQAAAPSYSDAVNAWNISVASLASMVRIEELEAKLAKAAEFARKECPYYYGSSSYDKWWHTLRTILTEIDLCPSCQEPLNLPSGDGCAAMVKHCGGGDA
jgi:hypothetical protein